ncbi:hypothetical protein [Leifsonia sp. WHRI 6310E]|uniref:hypothetical protein n=1 Tax=Leifsonia sp. WHRI 6310E TaxID=3162562 RepID=UPI0032ED1B2E
MSKRSRRQTRSRRFDLNWTRWPIHHNAEVALRKAERRILRGQPTTLAGIPVKTNPRIPPGMVVITITPIVVPEDPPGISLLDVLTRRHQIAEHYRTLDTLAGLGWDVRDEMDALAAEEAELTRAEL